MWKLSVDDISISNCASFSCSNFCFDWCQFFRSQFIRNGFNMLSGNNCLFDAIILYLEFYARHVQILINKNLLHFCNILWFLALLSWWPHPYFIVGNIGNIGYQCLMERLFQEGFSIFPIVLRLHLYPDSPTHLVQQISKKCINSES